MTELAIGIDLGGTQLRVAVIDRGSNVISRAAIQTDIVNGPNGVWAQIHALFDRVTADVALKDIMGVGVSSPGPLDTEAGIVLDIPTLPGWTDVPLRQIVSDRLGLPCIVENDGVAAAIGEWRFGAGAGLSHLAYLTISTGIGGGIISDGRVVRGRRGFAGHLGHMIIDHRSEAQCSCGAYGCFEALGAGSALSRRARVLAERPEGAAILAAAGLGPVDASHITIAARRGDATALAMLADEGRVLGIGFTSILHALSPEMIVVGGGVAQSFDLLEPTIAETIAARAMPVFRKTPVRRASLSENSGLIGAASLVFDPC